MSNVSYTAPILSTSFSQQKVMDYLVKKLESRAISINKTRLAVNNIADMQDLVENKKEMVKHFYEIEDDFNQSAQAIKALLAQNRDYAEQIEAHHRKIINCESKSASDLRIMNEINQQNNDLLQEIDIFKQELAEVQNSNLYLCDKNAYLESELKVKEKELEQFVEINRDLEEKYKTVLEENNLLRMREGDNMREKGNYYNDYNDQPYYTEEKEEETKRGNEFENNNNKNTTGDNIKSLISEREHTKKLINEKVKSHLSFTEKSVVITDSDERINTDKNEAEKIIPNNKKSKADIISKLILKSVESTESINLLNKRFGNNFMQKMLSDDVNEEFLEEVEEVLMKSNSSITSNRSNNAGFANKNEEISFRKKLNGTGEKNITKNTNNGTEYKFDEEFSPLNTEESRKKGTTKAKDFIADDKNIPVNEPAIKSLRSLTESKSAKSLRTLTSDRTKTKAKGKTLSLSFSSNSIYAGSNVGFEQSLRNYRGSSLGCKKAFVPYTNPYGGYFDKNKTFKAI